MSVSSIHDEINSCRKAIHSVAVDEPIDRKKPSSLRKVARMKSVTDGVKIASQTLHLCLRRQRFHIGNADISYCVSNISPAVRQISSRSYICRQADFIAKLRRSRRSVAAEDMPFTAKTVIFQIHFVNFYILC